MTVAVATERLLACLRLDSSPAEGAAPDDWTAEEWSAIRCEAEHHELEAVLFQRSTETAWGRSIPAAELQTLRELYCCDALAGERVRRDLAALLDAFRADAIPVIVLKGGHLVAAIYEDPALRPMADIDVLVRTVDLARADALLLAMGYGPAGRPPLDGYTPDGRHLATFRKPGSTPVEVHWTLAPPSESVRIDADRLWARACPATIAGIDALVLSPEDLLLHLCLHVSHTHRFGGSRSAGVALRHLYDIALVLERWRGEMDWTLLAAASNAAGAGRFVYCLARVSAELFGARLNERDLRALEHDAADEAMLALLREQLLAAPTAQRAETPVTYWRLREARGLRDSLGVLRRRLFPSPRHLASLYGLRADSPLVYAYYLRRPVDLLLRHGRTAVALLLRSRRARPLRAEGDRRRRIAEWVRKSSATGARPPV